jgi:hypothetical protein
MNGYYAGLHGCNTQVSEHNSVVSPSQNTANANTNNNDNSARQTVIINNKWEKEMQRLALLTTITVTAAIMSVLIPYQTAHAFPCTGGSGKEYCRGYHTGAVQADKDNAKGNVDVSQHPCSSSVDYCSGFTRGYDDEAGMLQWLKCINIFFSHL